MMSSKQIKKLLDVDECLGNRADINGRQNRDDGDDTQKLRHTVSRPLMALCNQAILIHTRLETIQTGIL